MAKSSFPSALELQRSLKKEDLKPVYYLCGEDSFVIDSTLKSIKNKVAPLITSDFDSETFYGENKNYSDVISFASAFPFGSEKKLIILKQAEKIRDKKNLTSYLSSPSDFTVLVCIHNGTISSEKSEPYKSLSSHNYIFEAKELKGKNLIKWIVDYVEENKKTISEDEAQLLVDIVGESRALIENQLQKILIYLQDEKTVTFEVIKKVSSELKTYTIFDLQNAMGKRDSSKAVFYALHLLENGTDATFIVNMLNRFFTGISRVSELSKMGIPDNSAARIVGTHWFYYKDYIAARRIYTHKDLVNTFRALLKADLSIKTSSADPKTIIVTLIAEILESKTV